MPKSERSGQIIIPEKGGKLRREPVIEKGLPKPRGSYDKYPKTVSKGKDAPNTNSNQPSVGFNKP